MKPYLRFLTGSFFYWLALFICLRQVFLLFENLKGYSITATEWLQASLYGIYMDLSMSAYLALPLVLLFLVHNWIPFLGISRVYRIVLTIAVILVTVSDMYLYQEWGFKLDVVAFRYLQHAREAGHFVSMGMFLESGFLVLLLFLLGSFLMKLLPVRVPETRSPAWFWNLAMIPLLLLALRGGMGKIPMNPGKVYFSVKSFPNHAALNTTWNLLHTLMQNDEIYRPMIFREESDAFKRFSELYPPADTASVRLLANPRPKILVLMLESFTSKLLEARIGGQEVTPQLNRWFRKGIFFSRAYASGDRTEIGMGALLSGFPAQPGIPVVQYPQKTEHLAGLFGTLNTVGYQTTFLYGGDASFAGMKTYLLNTGCRNILDASSFSAAQRNAPWGVHDHVLLERLYEEIRQDTGRFFKVCLTLTSHPPYEIPEPATFPGKDEETLFMNSAHYTDRCVGQLLDSLAADPAWKDLLVIVVADHGARLPGNSDYLVPERFHIPLWFGGGVIRQDTVIDRVVSQTDLAATLLNQLGLDPQPYTFSRDLFSRAYQPFAFYAFRDGFGTVDQTGSLAYGTHRRQLLHRQGTPTWDESYGQSVLQVVNRAFHNLGLENVGSTATQ